jgi:excisionase family DNA binding protein
MELEDRAILVEAGFLPVREAAKFLAISRAKLYQMMESGEVAYAKFGRARRIPRHALTDLAKRSIVARCHRSRDSSSADSSHS